jgi:hypothetical protein
MEVEILELIHVLEIGLGVSSSEYRNELLDFITESRGGFIDQLIQYHSLKKSFSQWCKTAGWSVSETI